MPNWQTDPTDNGKANITGTVGPLSRRRILQLGGVGLVTGTIATVSASSEDTDLENTIIIDASASAETTSFEFLVSGSAIVHPDHGSGADSGQINGGHVTGTLTGEVAAYRFNGQLSYLDVDGLATVTILYGEEPQSATDRIEIVASKNGSVDYEFTADGPIEKVLDNGDRSANEGEDIVVANNDGTWTADGSTENGYGDTYDVHGEITHFEPVTGEFTLFFNGEETTVTELTGQEVVEEEDEDTEPELQREHRYVFVATGDEAVDYYLEVEEGGDMIASTIDGSVIEEEYHWINDAGTKAAGRVQPGESHAYEFDTLIADVTIEGEAEAYVDGVSSDLDRYPRENASGDYWKGFFPWHIDGEERTHTYIFVPTGDEYIDYYLEVESGGDIIPSAIDDAIIEYEFFWISDDGTRAAGRVQPGDRHAYQFDTLIADVTIEGDGEAIVDGNQSDLDRYPLDTASGDYWKTGFPWQDEEHEPPGDDGGSGIGIRHNRYPGPLGGGDGMPSDLVYSASEADIVVTNGDVNAALNSASSGDVIYIQGSAGGFTADVANVTIAGNRGIGSDGRIRGAITVAANNVEFTGLSIDRGSRSSTAITINARGATFTNCLVENAGGARGAIRYPITNSGTTWRQCRFQNFSFYGHQIAYNWHDENNKIVFEYCDFNNLGQHMISGGYGWFHLRDNHFRGRLEHRHDHVIEVRGTGGAPVSCGTRCGNAIVEHNLCEARGSSGAAGLVRVRGVPTQGVWVERNVAPLCSAPTGGCESNGTHGGWRDQIVMQNASSSNSFVNVSVSDNEF